MTLSQRVQRARQLRYERRRSTAASVIPTGPYCYELTGTRGPESFSEFDASAAMRITICPYWKRRKDKLAGQDGYCRFLKAGDFTPGKRGTNLLWDHVKACGINDPD